MTQNTPLNVYLKKNYKIKMPTRWAVMLFKQNKKSGFKGGNKLNGEMLTSNYYF